MRILASGIVGVLAAALIGGCPQGGAAPVGGGGGPVTVQINVSSTSGSAPLSITANATGTSSTAGAIVSYSWTLDGAAHASGDTTSFNLTQPGRYAIELVARDAAGNIGSATQQIRVAGAGVVTAAIDIESQSAELPRAVQFDGSQSNATDDDIYDYFWNFGDGETGRGPRPLHFYDRLGTYVVELRVVTGGGVEATTTYDLTLTADAPPGSLQFAGSQFATLPLSGAALTTLTLTAWVSPEEEGGLIATLGGQKLLLSISPAANELRARFGGDSVVAVVDAPAGRWRHVGLTFDPNDPNDGVGLYIDGRQLVTGGLPTDLDVDALTLGGGFEGRIARVVVWRTIRSADQIAAEADSPPAESDPLLVGYWPIDDGSGQVIDIDYGFGDGVLGASEAAEAVDPAWSADGPP